jgi:integrase
MQLEQPEYTKFLASIPNPHTNREKRKKIEAFYDWIGDQAPTILEVTPAQFRDWFLKINTMNISESCKRRYRESIKSWIYWIISPKIAEGEVLKYNYEVIFSTRFVPLTPGGTHRTEHPFTKKDVEDCIAFYRDRNERDYFMVSVLAYTGMRVGGLVGIYPADFDFTERTIITHEKKTRTHSGENIYFIPGKFVNQLKGFVLECQTNRPGERIFNLDPKNVRKQLRLWRPTAHPHLFRDALNTRWEEQEMQEALRALLLNQTPSGVNSKHYLKKYRDLADRRAMYDKYFPY